MYYAMRMLIQTHHENKNNDSVAKIEVLCKSPPCDIHPHQDTKRYTVRVPSLSGAWGWNMIVTNPRLPITLLLNKSIRWWKGSNWRNCEGCRMRALVSATQRSVLGWVELVKQRYPKKYLDVDRKSLETENGRWTKIKTTYDVGSWMLSFRNELSIPQNLRKLKCSYKKFGWCETWKFLTWCWN